jgi:Protein of unknown function (DUF2442)
VIKILRVRSVAPHVLELQFSGGELAHFEGTSYLQHRQGPLLQALHDPGYFAKAFIDAGALCWPNGFELSAKRALELSRLLVA